MSDWVLAIDFGTSATAAVVAAPGSAPEVVEIGGAARVPSVVAALDDESLVAGDAAVRQLAINPERVERAPKRRLGDRAVLLGDRAVAPTALVAAVLRLVADEAIRRRGGTPPSVVRLTHPASWASTRLEALRAAAAAAGLPEPELLAEPVAAALLLSDDRIAVGDHVAVYDLGGGTFDAAVLRRTADSFELVGPPGGHDRVGGEDLDEKLLEHVGESIRQQDAEAWERLRFSDERAWRRAAAALRTEVRVAKESLSGAPSATVYVPAPVDLEVHVTREELETLVRPDLERTVEELLATVERAGSPALKAIYLVGGGSRMPLVGRLVAERTGITPTTWGDPKASVALGAAVSRGMTETPTGVIPIPLPAAVAAAPVEPAPAPRAEPAVVPPPRTASRRKPVLLGSGVAAALIGVVTAVLVSGGGGGSDGKDKPTDLAGDRTQVPAYPFAAASDSAVRSARTWTLDKTGSTLSNETVLTNDRGIAVTRTVVEVVPKQVAQTVADVQFEPGYTVVQDDPVVRYTVTLAPKGTRTLRWTRTLPSPVDAAGLTLLARAQTAAEDAIAPRLASMVPASVLAKAPLMPFKKGADPVVTTRPTVSPTPSATTQPGEPSDSPTPRPTATPAVTSAPPVAVNHPPSLAALASVTANESTLPSVTADGNDPDGDRLSYSASGLPAGLGISASTGRLTGSISYTAASGTPRSASSLAIASKAFSVKVTVKDPKGLQASRTFTLTVRDTKGVMPNFIGGYGDGGGGKPNIASISTPNNDCSQNDGSVADGAIWRQGVAPGTVITYGQVISYWYRNDAATCTTAVAKGW